MVSSAAEALRNVFGQRVGGFFRNTYRRPGATCAVCSGPTPDSVCSR